MKLSGPGLLFAGRFLITVPISVLIMGLLRFSISSWFSFGRVPESSSSSQGISLKGWAVSVRNNAASQFSWTAYLLQA